MSDLEWEIQQIDMAIQYHKLYNPRSAGLKFRATVTRLIDLRKQIVMAIDSNLA